MSTTRLDSVAPDVAQILRSAATSSSLAAAVAVARFALSATAVREPVANEALLTLERGASPQLLLPELKRLVEHYDEKYFQLQAKADEHDSMTWFSQARALSAVVFAVEANPMEACYESQAATDNIAEVRAVVRKAAGG